MCAVRGHVVPAATVAHLRAGDSGLGLDLADGRRLSRCLRCDTWLAGTPPPAARAARMVLPPLDELEVPRRGRALRDAIVLRLIALDRAFHSVAFGLAAIGLFILGANIDPLRSQADSLLDQLDKPLSDTGQNPSRTFVVRVLRRIGHLRRGPLRLLAATAAAYCVIEAVEALGLWRERRWAEYLTALATAGFLPFEIAELGKRVTVVRVVALVVNLAILVWLVWRKNLFGVRGEGGPAEDADPVALFGPGAASGPG